MSLKQSEAIVLRTYPLREADLLVTLFTRAEGKVKGIARAAKKSKRRFGGASKSTRSSAMRSRVGLSCARFNASGQRLSPGGGLRNLD